MLIWSSDSRCPVFAFISGEDTSVFYISVWCLLQVCYIFAFLTELQLIKPVLRSYVLVTRPPLCFISMSQYSASGPLNICVFNLDLIWPSKFYKESCCRNWFIYSRERNSRLSCWLVSVKWFEHSKTHTHKHKCTHASITFIYSLKAFLWKILNIPQTDRKV